MNRRHHQGIPSRNFESSRYRLNAEQLHRYERDGCLFPLQVLSDNEVTDVKSKLEFVEAKNDGHWPSRFAHKPHIVFTWLDSLVRHQAILDTVEAIVGPNILCWSSRFFIKDPWDGGFVSWHQDIPYWGLDIHGHVVTAWLALSPATRENGVMKVVPGTHKKLVAHREAAANNLLRRGQEVAVDVDEGHAIAMELRPGELSLHHGLLFHGSEANKSGERRIGYAIRYIPTSMKPLAGLPRDTATLVRGVDSDGHFDLAPAPVTDLSPEAVAIHARACQVSDEIRDKAASMHTGLVNCN